MNQSKSDSLSHRIVLLSTEELRYLMQVAGVDALVGVELADVGVSFETPPASLEAKGLLKFTPQGAELAQAARPLLESLLFPTRAILAIRDIPKVGKQLLIFNCRAGQVILHTRPDENTHRLAGPGVAEDALATLLEWLPLDDQICLPGSFILDPPIFENARLLAESGKIEAALQVLKDVLASHEEKESFVKAIQERQMNGSLAFLQIEEGAADEVVSIGLLVGLKSAWVFGPVIQNGKTLQGLLHVKRVSPELFRDQLNSLVMTTCQK